MTHPPAATPPTAEQVERGRQLADILFGLSNATVSLDVPTASAVVIELDKRLAAVAPAERAEAVPDQSIKEFDAMSDIPRRIQIEKLTPAENAIRLANEAVEALPADVRLTSAQVFLSKARDLVADYIDGIEAPTRAGALDAAGAIEAERRYPGPSKNAGNKRRAFANGAVWAASIVPVPVPTTMGEKAAHLAGMEDALAAAEAYSEDDHGGAETGFYYGMSAVVGAVSGRVEEARAALAAGDGGAAQ